MNQICTHSLARLSTADGAVLQISRGNNPCMLTGYMGSRQTGRLRQWAMRPWCGQSRQAIMSWYSQDWQSFRWLSAKVTKKACDLHVWPTILKSHLLRSSLDMYNLEWRLQYSHLLTRYSWGDQSHWEFSSANSPLRWGSVMAVN